MMGLLPLFSLNPKPFSVTPEVTTAIHSAEPGPGRYQPKHVPLCGTSVLHTVRPREDPCERLAEQALGPILKSVNSQNSPVGPTAQVILCLFCSSGLLTYPPTLSSYLPPNLPTRSTVFLKIKNKTEKQNRQKWNGEIDDVEINPVWRSIIF